MYTKVYDIANDSEIFEELIVGEKTTYKIRR